MFGSGSSRSFFVFQGTGGSSPGPHLPFFSLVLLSNLVSFSLYSSFFSSFFYSPPISSSSLPLPTFPPFWLPHTLLSFLPFLPLSLIHYLPLFHLRCFSLPFASHSFHTPLPLIPLFLPTTTSFHRSLRGDEMVASWCRGRGGCGRSGGGYDSDGNGVGMVGGGGW